MNIHNLFLKSYQINLTDQYKKDKGSYKKLSKNINVNFSEEKIK